MTRGLALSMLLSVAAGAAIGALLSHPVSPPASGAGTAAPARPGASFDSPSARQLAADAATGVAPAGADEPEQPVAMTIAGYRDWARRDPDAFLTALPAIAAAGDAARVIGDDSRNRIADDTGVSPVRLAGEANPGLALEIAKTLDGGLGTTIRAAALESLASQDPGSALAYIEAIGPGNLRRRLVDAVAAGFARHDLDAAVDWWLTLSDSDRAFARGSIIAAVAAVDLVSAIDLDQQSSGRPSAGGDSAWLMAGLESGRQDPSRVADKLAGIQATRLLADTMGWWIHRDTFGAIGWVMSQETVSATAIERMARTLTEKDSQSALALAAQFPPAVRARWIETVVSTLADYDPIGALDVLARFEGEPFHAEALSGVAGAIALSLGPETAAVLAGRAPGVNTALVIVENWDDARRAAEWAIAIEDGTAREYAVEMAVTRWARSDAAAARSWVAGLQDHDLRDFLTDSLCQADASCVER